MRVYSWNSLTRGSLIRDKSHSKPKFQQTIHNNLYNRGYQPLPERAGLADEGFTFHGLRRTFAIKLFDQRKRSKIIQSLLGHSSIAQTMGTFSYR